MKNVDTWIIVAAGLAAGAMAAALYWRQYGRKGDPNAALLASYLSDTSSAAPF